MFLGKWGRASVVLKQGKATSMFIFDLAGQVFFCSHVSESVSADPNRFRAVFKVLYHVGPILLSICYFILSYDYSWIIALGGLITICRLLLKPLH